MEIRLSRPVHVTDAQVENNSIRSRRSVRALDLTLLVLFGPLILLVGIAIAIAIFVDSPGSVIFRSTRIGRGGRPFTMFKFRKMHAGAQGHALTLRDDERFTPIGRFLAATRLDELPQVWNVIRGDMRLVGPRPEIECFVAEFPNEYAEILTLTPGITGVAQLQFLDENHLLHGDDPSAAYSARVLPDKVKVDLAYVRTRTLPRDLAILSRTALMPFVVAWRRLGAGSGHIREWASAGAVAMVVLALFALSSGNIF